MRKEFFLCFIIGMIVSGFPHHNAAAATYYVDASNGNNANTCIQAKSETTPKADVTNGITCLASGDTLLVKNGTYRGGFTITGPSGTASAHTIIAAYPGHAPILDNGSISNGRMKITGGCSYIVFRGFTITRHAQGLHIDDDDATGVACTNIIVDAITVHDVGQEGIMFRSGTGTAPRNSILKNSTVYNTGMLRTLNGEGIYIGHSSRMDRTNGVTLLNNKVYNTQDECIELKGDSYNIIVDGNNIHNCHTPGSSYGNTGGAIEIDEPRNFTSNPNHIIRNNIIHDLVFKSSYTKRAIRVGTGATIYNNIIYNIDSTYNCILSNSANYPRLVYHNTIDCRTDQALVNSGTSLTATSNIGPTSIGNIASSPSLYVNKAVANYKLATGSTAIDAGADLTSIVPTDIEGRSRPVGLRPDIGAYEYDIGVLAPPPAPTGLLVQ